jgi:hypothetical protein
MRPPRGGYDWYRRWMVDDPQPAIRNAEAAMCASAKVLPIVLMTIVSSAEAQWVE